MTVVENWLWVHFRRHAAVKS